MKTHFAALLIAMAALAATAFADDATTAAPSQAKQAGQPHSLEQQAKRAAHAQRSGEKKTAAHQARQHKMKMHHEGHAGGHQFRQGMAH